MEQTLLPWATRAVQWHDRLMAIPAARSWAEVIGALVSLSGSFWLLSKALGYAALTIHRLLDHSLAELFAVVYNIALAVAYSSVLVFAAIKQRGGKDDFLAFEAAGFVFVYVMLTLTYSERSGKITEHALPGYWLGIASYLFFCLRTQYLVNPVTPKAYAAVEWLVRTPIGRWVTLFGVAAAVLQLLKSLGRAAGRSLRGLTPKRRAA